MESLPNEIIDGEILVRLPVKSVLRFRCVSKSWRSLIGSESFMKTHHQNSIQNPSFPHQRVILHKMYGMPMQCSLQSLMSEAPPSDLSPLEDPAISSVHFVGCCNGLVCMSDTVGRIYLWNPSTRISSRVPDIPNRTSAIVNYGFGWDESSGAYKVFALLLDKSSSSNRANFYSSTTKSWKRKEFNFTDDYLAPERVVVGAKLHWRNPSNLEIIFLDFKSEVFGRIEQPFDEEYWCSEVLGRIGGCLCMLYRSGRDVRVWVMKEESYSWERLVCLSLDHELLQRPFSASSFTHKGSNGEIYVFHGSTFLVYHPLHNVFRVPKACLWYASQDVFVESLVSPESLVNER